MDKNERTEAQAAKLLGVQISTLQKWFQRGYGPRRFKLAKRIWYKVADLEAFRESCGSDPRERAALRTPRRRRKLPAETVPQRPRRLRGSRP